MLFIFVSVSNICAMAKNNTHWIRLDHLSQTASVRHERGTTRTTRPQVADNSFDDASTWQPQGSHPHGSRSRLSQAYDVVDPEVPGDAEAPKVQEKVVVDAPLKNYPWGIFDTSLLHLYVDHAARHVRE